MPAKDTQEMFVKKATARFGHGRFDFSMCVYSNGKKKVKIRCIRHNVWFELRASGFLAASPESGGCPKCAGEVKGKKARAKYSHTVDEFIRRARAKWGYRFDYSQSTYVNTHTPLLITCLRHKESYFQAPSNHYTWTGCKKCASETLSNQSSFSQSQYVDLVRQIHGDLYEYGEYKGMSSTITIYCQIHGPFNQIANDHRNGSKCPKCAATERGVLIRITPDNFISRCEIVHNFKYIYSRTKYVRMCDEISILCPTHGLFQQNAGAHLGGHGCPKCSLEKQAQEKLLSTEEFVGKARVIHGDRYDYSFVEYKGTKEPVQIICPDHGAFLQVPNYHLTGNGCQTCANENKGRDGIVNFMGSSSWASQKCFLYVVEVLSFLKIGIAKNISNRARSGKVNYTIRKFWEADRATAWLVEQVLLRKTEAAKPKKLPPFFSNWAGRSELRDMDLICLDTLFVLAETELSKALKIGWKEYALINCIGEVRCFDQYEY